MAPLISAGLNIILFLGTVRQPRNADRVLKFIQPALEARNITVTVFDPLELHLDEVIKPIQYYNKSAETIPQSLLDLQTRIKAADGFVVVTAEYHGSIAPGLLNVMNQFPPNAYVFRPGAIFSYSKGRFGGIRAAMQLRSYLSDLGLIQVPGITAIPFVEERVALNGTTIDKSIDKSAEATIDQLIWFAEAIKNEKAAHGLRCTDCFDDTNLGYKGLPYNNKK
ncbi:hypothetical protein BV898_19289, partial [Hypsibius exemplaris]